MVVLIKFFNKNASKCTTALNLFYMVTRYTPFPLSSEALILSWIHGHRFLLGFLPIRKNETNVCLNLFTFNYNIFVNVYHFKGFGFDTAPFN